MQKIQKPDAVLTSGFWHFTRRGEKLGIRNEKLGIEGGAEWIVGGQWNVFMPSNIRGMERSRPFPTEHFIMGDKP